MPRTLQMVLISLVLFGCEIGGSVDPDEATNELHDQRLVDFTCGDSLVTTDLPARFPIEDNEIAGIWDFLQECGGIAGSCLVPDDDAEKTVLAFELSGRYSFCRFDSSLESGIYVYDADEEYPELYLSGGAPDSRATTYRVEFESPDTLWLNPGCCDQFSLQFAARTFD